MNKSIHYYIRTFLDYYLSDIRSFSSNTIHSYRDTIKLFLIFLNTTKKLNLSKMDFQILKQENIHSFLDWLSKNRNCSNNTLNQRLACLKSLCNYIIQEEPLALDYCQEILNLNFKRVNHKMIEHLSEDELKSLFNKIDLSTKQGKKEFIILTVLYDGGLRISELINLKVENVKFNNPTRLLILNSKNNKSREIPINENTSNLLKNYINGYNLKKGSYLFLSNQNKPYSQNGIRKIISKYTKKYSFKVTPHTFRHSKACHLVSSNIPLIYIRDFLGHAHVETTEIYAKVCSKVKDDAIINHSIQLDNDIKYSLDDTDLIEWLQNL